MLLSILIGLVHVVENYRYSSNYYSIIVVQREFKLQSSNYLGLNMPPQKWRFIDAKLPTIFDILAEVDRGNEGNDEGLHRFLTSFNPTFLSARDNTPCSQPNCSGILKRVVDPPHFKNWWRCGKRGCQKYCSLMDGTVLTGKKFRIGT